MDVRRRVEDVLTSVLPRGADLAIVDADRSHLVVEVEGGPRFDVRWLTRGWPRQVRHALEQGPSPDVLVAPEMSPGARALADEAHVGWADEQGAASFVIDSIIVSREPKRSRPGQGHPSWTPSTLAVVESILTGTRATVAGVTQRTGLSDGTASRALRLLDDAGFLASAARRGRHSGRWLAEPGELLDTYAEQALRLRRDLSVQIGVDATDPVSEIVDLGRRWTRESRLWAATGALAAHFQGPYLQRPAPLEVYLDVESLAGLEGAARAAGLAIIEGGRLTLRPFPSPATATLSYFETIGGVQCRCVPWPRTFADLRPAGVRGEEAAEHLRDLHLPAAEHRGAFGAASLR